MPENALEITRNVNPDPVKAPAHYLAEDPLYEHYKVVYAWGLDYALGCATKYIRRSGHKPGVDAVEDLKKAIRYIEIRIEYLEKGRK